MKYGPLTDSNCVRGVCFPTHLAQTHKLSVRINMKSDRFDDSGKLAYLSNFINEST